MLEALIVILVLFWLLGVIGHIGGGLIYALLVIALVLFIVRLIDNRPPRL